MEKTDIKGAIEAILIASSDPVKPGLVAELLEQPLEVVIETFNELERDYLNANKGYYIAEVAGGYRFQVKPNYGAIIARFLTDFAPVKLSKAALETLAIVAYRQPISKAQISAIRGVNSDSTVKYLTDLGLIEPKEVADGPGAAILLGTTELFLQTAGLNSISDLPNIAEFIPDSKTIALIEERLSSFLDD
jgi:segregation and condensation protein B